MNTSLRLSPLICIWLLSIFGLYHWQSVLYSQYTAAPYSTEFNSAQQNLYDEFIARKQALAPQRRTILETNQIIYEHGDGSFSTHPPTWYQHGIIVLSLVEKKAISDLATITAPDWLFWKHTLTVSEFNDLLDRLALAPLFASGVWVTLGILAMLIARLAPEIIVGSRTRLALGALAGTAVCLLTLETIGPVVGLVTWVMIALVFELLYYSKLLWHHHTDASIQTQPTTS